MMRLLHQHILYSVKSGFIRVNPCDLWAVLLPCYWAHRSHGLTRMVIP